MDQLTQDIEQLAGDKPQARPEAKEAARARLIALEAAPKKSGANTWLHRLPAVGAVAAALVAVTMVVPSGTNEVDQRQASTPLGLFLVEAASAADTSAQPTTDTWKVDTTTTYYWVEDDSKYGRYTGIPRVVDGTNISSAKGEEAEFFRRPMSLPTDTDDLREELSLRARNEVASLQGDTASIDKAEYEKDFYVSSLVTLLNQPMRAETRASVLVLLSEAADQGAMDDLGVKSDSTGRSGRAFKGGRAADEFIVAADGTLLERTFFNEGKVWDRTVYRSMAFVN